MCKSKNTMNNYPEQAGVNRVIKQLEMINLLPIQSSTQSKPNTPDSRLKTLDLPSKQFFWKGPYYAGDCQIDHIWIVISSDGTAKFEAMCQTTDCCDAWVFYDGVSFYDGHTVKLFQSGKLVGPNMTEEYHSYLWEAQFFFPAVFFDSIGQASINGMHC